KLALETAEIGLRAYEQGVVVQLTKEFAGRIALARSDAQRQANRVSWTEAMVAKGYLSESQLLSERQALGQSRHDLSKVEGEFRLFERFNVPKEKRTLLSQVTTAQNNYRVEADRLKAEEGQLTTLRKEIANCVIRAPHAGTVLHANDGHP